MLVRLRVQVRLSGDIGIPSTSANSEARPACFLYDLDNGAKKFTETGTTFCESHSFVGSSMSIDATLVYTSITLLLLRPTLFDRRKQRNRIIRIESNQNIYSTSKIIFIGPTPVSK
jgi:hypothetical protein